MEWIGHVDVEVTREKHGGETDCLIGLSVLEKQM